MRKLTAELKTISVCARSIISKSQGGHFLSSLSSNSSSSVLDEFSITSYMVGMSFHTWQKINIQTMAKDIRVNLFSVACMLCCCGLDWTRTSILFRLKGSSGKIGESWRLEHRADCLKITQELSHFQRKYFCIEFWVWIFALKMKINIFAHVLEISQFLAWKFK